MSTSLPPDLRVICRKLASSTPTQLLHSLPSLVNHVIRCKQALSIPSDPKPAGKGDASESSILVHKLKTSINTLINGRTKEGRFVAISLIKAAVDVGGWEVLRGSGPWVQGLLGVVQKGDPIASKELAIVALTKIYILIHPYQTIVREVATPTIPEFSKACVQILKSSAGEDATPETLYAAETICESFSAMIPLYPATFRPSSSQAQNAIKQFLAPTLSDDAVIPESLREAARQMVITQHFVAAKTGGSDEWVKVVNAILAEFHGTADQVLRAVDEAWTPSDGTSRGNVNLEAEPQGGGSGPNQFTPWTGIQAGSQRLIELLHYLCACLRYPTKSQVAIPLSRLMDATSRVCLIARLSPKTQTWDQSLQTKAAIGREEKEELWSVIPDIHTASLQVFRVLFQRFGQDTLPLAPEILDHITRIFNSGIDIPTLRATTYQTLKDVFSVSGPTLSKSTVDMLGSVVGACCRDLQEDAGHLRPSSKTTHKSGETKKNGVSVNADLFLQKPEADSGPQPVTLDSAHRAAASALLAAMLAEIPQEHFKPSLRSLLDQTAILSSDRDALLASVLNPFVDAKGRRYPSLLPHLTRLFPQDQALEVLRTNLRTDVGQLPSDEQVLLDEENDSDEEMAEKDAEDQMSVDEQPADSSKPPSFPADAATTHTETTLPLQSNPFAPNSTEQKISSVKDNAFGDARARAASPPKRKHEGPGSASAKRQELEKSSDVPKATSTSAPQADAADEDDSDDDESIHLNMELEDDDDDEEE